MFRTLTISRTPAQIGEPAKSLVDLREVYEPPGDPIAYLIFIHGLGGGSRKAWAKDEGPWLSWLVQLVPER